MKYDLPCDVIRDLLPSYVDKLTSNESNEIIKEHLNNCESCNATHFAMISNDEQSTINVSDKKSFKIARKKLATIIVSCVLAFAVVFSGVWVAVNWYTTSDFLTTDDYTITVEKIDKKDITFKKVKTRNIDVFDNVSGEEEYQTVMYFEGIESNYPLRDDLVELIEKQGFVYNITVSSDKYTIDDVVGGLIDENNATRIEVWSHHKNKFSKHQKHSSSQICFDDITAIYGYSKETYDAGDFMSSRDLIWSADKK